MKPPPLPATHILKSLPKETSWFWNVEHCFIKGSGGKSSKVKFHTQTASALSTSPHLCTLFPSPLSLTDFVSFPAVELWQHSGHSLPDDHIHDQEVSEEAHYAHDRVEGHDGYGCDHGRTAGRRAQAVAPAKPGAVQTAWVGLVALYMGQVEPGGRCWGATRSQEVGTVAGVPRVGEAVHGAESLPRTRYGQ